MRKSCIGMLALLTLAVTVISAAQDNQEGIQGLYLRLTMCDERPFAYALT